MFLVSMAFQPYGKSDSHHLHASRWGRDTPHVCRPPPFLKLSASAEWCGHLCVKSLTRTDSSFHTRLCRGHAQFLPGGKMPFSYCELGFETLTYLSTWCKKQMLWNWYARRHDEMLSLAWAKHSISPVGEISISFARALIGKCPGSRGSGQKYACSASNSHPLYPRPHKLSYCQPWQWIHLEESWIFIVTLTNIYSLMSVICTRNSWAYYSNKFLQCYWAYSSCLSRLLTQFKITSFAPWLLLYLPCKTYSLYIAGWLETRGVINWAQAMFWCYCFNMTHSPFDLCDSQAFLSWLLEFGEKGLEPA